MMSKPAFHRRYRQVLESIAADLGLVDGTYEIHSNKGGPGVLGEVILHGETIYIVICKSPPVALPWDPPGGEGYSVMYRSCAGRKDYTGGRNRWMPVEMLSQERDRALANLRTAMAASERGP